MAPLVLALLSPLAGAQDYSFPTSAEDYGSFYVTAYYDHSGVDWDCGTYQYSGHRGSDFGVGSWSGMDAGRDITAAADGTVIATNDGEYDECSTGDCSGGGGYGNYVKLEHADGKTTIYAHMKKWSVAVSTGDHVACGDKLGEVGSSGYSTGPHLHFEVRTSSGSQVDPFYGSCSSAPSYWVDQGSYMGLPGRTCDGSTEVGPCEPVAELSCGDQVTARNDGAGSQDEHGSYGCTEWWYSGSEIAFWFATHLDETVALSVTGMGADLDVLVLDDRSCDGGGCVASSDNPDASDESLEFAATAGHPYVVVLDGWEDATSEFQLSFSCEGHWPGGGDPETGDPGTDTGSPDSGRPDTGDGWGDEPEDGDRGPHGYVVPGERGGGAGCGCGGGGVANLAWLAGVAVIRRRREGRARAGRHR